MAEPFVRKRILSPPAGVACSNRLELSSANQSGSSSSTAEGWITAPERICAPISPAFSRSSTRKSSLPASFASCFNRIAALSPAGPVTLARADGSKLLQPYLRQQCKHRPGRFLDPDTLDQSHLPPMQIFAGQRSKMRVDWTAALELELELYNADIFGLLEVASERWILELSLDALRMSRDLSSGLWQYLLTALWL